MKKKNDIEKGEMEIKSKWNTVQSKLSGEALEVADCTLHVNRCGLLVFELGEGMCAIDVDLNFYESAHFLKFQSWNISTQIILYISLTAFL